MDANQQGKQSPQVQALLQDTARLRQLLATPEVRQLAQLLDRRSEGTLQRSAQSAQAGDTGALEQLMQGLADTQEGAQLIAKLQQKLQL